VLAYYGVDVRGDELIKALGTAENGTPTANLIAIAKSRGFQVEAGPGWTLGKVKRFVDEAHPVIVLLQAWADRYMTLEDWRNDYDDGHYAIVIGHSKGVLLFEDPASFRRSWLRESEFVARWHDLDSGTSEKLEHWGMVLLGRKPADKTPHYMR
jgi:ABC-type bacteriocin/lantibiotic exporter with double-glycine peptidase domain